MADLGTLANLPAELLDQVLDEVDSDPCALLSVGKDWRNFVDTNMHGIPPGILAPSQARAWMNNKGTRTVNGLASLCLVSRRLNKLATPRLYRSLSEYYVKTGWLLLVRTLVARRDLAELVKDLEIKGLTIPNDLPLPLPEVAAYYADQLALHPDAGLPENGFTSSDPDLDALSEAVTALMVSLCPNLETLTCESYCREEDGPMFPLCKPASMPHLVELTFTHADTELGFELGEAAPLLRAAPNLEILCLQQAGSWQLPDDLKLERVTFLSMWGCIEGGELVAMLRLCPNLEELKYECGGPCYGYEHFSPREAADAVLAHGPHLKKFELDLNEWESMQVPDFTTQDMQAAKRVLEGRGVQCAFTIDYDRETRELIYVD
ncbi:hypothetical protein QBC34DRAFT_490035 [Podospora aff. communis PSN243]|uniref:F-box domain-containing protein n=1 Tax=Podospora aff. communis PSN243 TaxID=3040156 RepID=A0AAV9H5B4_9PEZI|nr:hypothetical protein QBC34DRAFT_490035 [Podospora aff. communis PSN243]